MALNHLRARATLGNRLVSRVFLSPCVRLALSLRLSFSLSLSIRLSLAPLAKALCILRFCGSAANEPAFARASELRIGHGESRTEIPSYGVTDRERSRAPLGRRVFLGGARLPL